MSNTDPEFSSKPAALPEPAARLVLLGPAPLFEGEDTAAYDELLARISGAVKPADIFEEIWVRDIVDLVWGALRPRRLKANLMTATAYRGPERFEAACRRLPGGGGTRQSLGRARPERHQAGR